MKSKYVITKPEHFICCVHYCDVGGHLWHHTTETKRWEKEKFMTIRTKGFPYHLICPDHRPKYEKYEDEFYD